jgi:hypothetical protein
MNDGFLLGMAQVLETPICCLKRGDAVDEPRLKIIRRQEWHRIFVFTRRFEVRHFSHP